MTTKPEMLTTDQFNAVYNAICVASNRASREQRILGSYEIFQIMTEAGLE